MAAGQFFDFAYRPDILDAFESFEFVREVCNVSEERERWPSRSPFQELERPCREVRELERPCWEPARRLRDRAEAGIATEGPGSGEASRVFSGPLTTSGPERRLPVARPVPRRRLQRGGPRDPPTVPRPPARGASCPDAARRLGAEALRCNAGRPVYALMQRLLH